MGFHLETTTDEFDTMHREAAKKTARVSGPVLLKLLMDHSRALARLQELGQKVEIPEPQSAPVKKGFIKRG